MCSYISLLQYYSQLLLENSTKFKFNDITFNKVQSIMTFLITDEPFCVHQHDVAYKRA